MIAAAALTFPVLGDESCDATTADASNEGEVCTQTDDNSDNVIVDDSKITEEGIERPIWWDYNIDQLFEDYFDCGQIIYGYEDDDYNSGDDDQADDFQDSQENDAETDDFQDSQESNEEKIHDENADPVSDVQLQKLRQQWAVIREKYVKEVNLVPIKFHEKSDSPTAKTSDSNNRKINQANDSNHGVSAMVVPSRVGDAGPGKGRGVFATEPIPKGTLVSNLDNGTTGIFKEGHSWRKFAASLPKETACNFIEWSWVQNIPPENEIDDDIRNGLTIFIAFDESNLLNNADWDGVEANVRCGHPPKREGDEWGPCRFHYYAARDIAAGEELLINYGEFEDVDQEGWTDIGL